MRACRSPGVPRSDTAILRGTEVVVLRMTASLKYNYEYRPPMEAARIAGLVWTDENLDQYLQGPEAFLQRVTGKTFDHAFYMNFYIGGQDAGQVGSRRDVIAYLRP